jgi:hypothetical protein
MAAIVHASARETKMPAVQPALSEGMSRAAPMMRTTSMPTSSSDKMMVLRFFDGW